MNLSTYGPTFSVGSLEWRGYEVTGLWGCGMMRLSDHMVLDVWYSSTKFRGHNL